jgi:hypothetical protein
MGVRTGTFFCEMTTAQSLPLTPTDVMLAAVMALNAYSCNNVNYCLPGAELSNEAVVLTLHTDLVETTLVREDGNVSVISCTSYTWVSEWFESSKAVCCIPDMIVCLRRCDRGGCYVVEVRYC